MSLQVGQLILNQKYRVEHEIGRGAFGEVFLVTHIELNLPRAVKLLRADAPGVGSTQFNDYRQRFRLEFQLTAKIEHPNLIKVYDFAEEDGTLYAVMEYVPNGSLGDLLKANGPLPISQVVSLLADCAHGLQVLHEQLDAVHRDVKPSNILLDKNGNAKIADLGLAQVGGGHMSLRSELGSVAPPHPGTPNYTSPEHTNGTEPLTPSSDVFSLGCVAFEMLTGQPWKRAMRKVRTAKELRADVPEDLNQIVAHMLRDEPGLRVEDASNPAKRYVDMDAVLAALGRVKLPRVAAAKVMELAEGMPTLKPVKEMKPAIYRPLSRRAFAIGATGVGLVVVAARLLSAMPSRPTQVPETTKVAVVHTVVVTEPPMLPTSMPVVLATSTKGDKTLTIGFYQEPSATYANYSTQTFAAWLGDITNIGVWYYDEKGAPVLELAEEFPSVDKGTISADGKTITYKLKKGLKWSDGEPLTSADFKFTWEQIMKPENTGMASRAGYDQIEKIDTPDAQTAVVVFKEVYAPWGNLFLPSGGGIIPQHALKDLKTMDGSPYVTTGAGPFSGPFTIQEVVKGDRIVLAANPNYWRGKPKLDTVNIKIVESREAVLAGLRAGDIDIGPDFVEATIPDLEGVENINTFAVPSSSFEHYFFNFGKGDDATGPAGPCAFTDENVRKAITMGIDRFTIADKLLFGKTRVIASLWPVAPWENTELKPYPYDPEAAKKLLDDAGYTPGADGIRVGQCGGQEVKLSFKHTTTSGNQLRANVQTLVQENLKDIGVEFISDNKASSIVFASWTDGGTFTKGDYEFGCYTTGFVAGGDPSPSDAFKISGIPTEKNPSGGNNYHLVDEELDKLSLEQEKASDPVKRKEIIFKMQQIMYDKAYVIPMYARLAITAANKRVTGMKMVPDNIFDVFTNAWEWDVTQ